MASFNMPALTSSATPTAADALGLTAGAQLVVDPFSDQDLNFDDAILDTVNHNLHGLPYTPSYDFDTFSTTFEDPFAYSASARAPFDTSLGLGGLGSNVLGNGTGASAGITGLGNGGGGVLHQHVGGLHHHGDADGFLHGGDVDLDASSPQEPDTKLLEFGPMIAKAGLVDETGAMIDVDVRAELYGMFFVAEDVYTDANTAVQAANRPLELTCYRRNLWQCSTQITLPRQHLAALVTEQGRRVEVLDLATSITAIESIEGKPTEIISIPWKSGTTTSEEPPSKVTGAPPHLQLDLSSGQELDGNRVVVSAGWKRLQFKHATANNGRRKGLQQHYVVQINLLAKTARADGDEEFIKVAEVQSAPVIVRGRSPRNFDSRKDIQLSTEKKPERKSTDATAGPLGTPGKQPERTGSDLAPNMPRYPSVGGSIGSGSDWGTPFPSPNPSGPPSKKVALQSPSVTRPPVPPWAPDNNASSMSSSKQIRTEEVTAKRSSVASSQSRPGAAALPINLSLSEDERSPNRSGSDGLQSPQYAKSMAAVATASGQAAAGSPKESEDMLYEYFPLSLDDWMPPVDAIYRPHVVHHTYVPPEMKAQQTRSKTKRYFAAE